ncbi:MAG: pectinesterase family protein [Clostridiales bacterium]|nr:pectinesterase family protein [Clostridiales bacterium]
MYIIAKDGSGDFTSIQAAIDAIPQSSRHLTILLMRMDEYQERVIVNKDNVRIIGEARDRTVITASACAKDLNEAGQPQGTFLSATFLVTGRNVEVENLTIRNDAGDGDAVGQAVAVYAAGDRGVWRNVRMIAHQDTLFCGPTMPKVARAALPRLVPEGVPSVGDCPAVIGRQYFEDCFIQGDVDFIFGPYTCWFERCTLFMNRRGGYYTAANTPEQAPFGLVFHRCRLSGECEAGQGYLGRPWRAWAHTVFLHCDMDEHVSPEGFQDWQGGASVTERCGEYATTGARADQSTRHPSQRRLTAEDAARYTIRNVIGGYDGWNPQRRTPTWFLCGDSTMADYAPCFAPMTGWGQALKDLVDDAFVENCAVCGRSSKSFVAEKRLGFVELCLRKGDKLFIQFGHNDEKEDIERATQPWVTYPEYLGMYIDAARAQGAEPILLTPIARRHFDENGCLKHTHGDYPAAMRNLATHRNVRLLDMEKATEALLASLGAEGSKALFNWQEKGHPNYPDGVQDNTHLSDTGAMRLAQLALDLLSAQDA